MKNYIKHHEWHIIEEGFDPHLHRVSESLFSIGNGRMGQRANFEEEYSGEMHQGSYVAGVYYPDKTRVGWWKNGYPEYFAKVLNAPNWIGIRIQINGQSLDLAKCKVENFRRVLDMKQGVLHRTFVATLPDGKRVAVDASRFCSMHNGEIGAIRYAITPLNFSAAATLVLDVDADVVNKDSNYDEKFWNEVSQQAYSSLAMVTAETRKTLFHVTTGMTWQLEQGGKKVDVTPKVISRNKYAGHELAVSLRENEPLVIVKYAAVLSSENHPKATLEQAARQQLEGARAQGFDNLLKAHAAVWAHKWEECDITIDGDVAAQQGIRFNIFQLMQTYTGDDERLNIGPKGFTGEKYGGSTYWDTEAYCIPFYLGTAPARVARQLLEYRYRQLDKAIANARKLGFKDGAALFPMVTMNGEECHNEWEITFEEIHRNGAMVYAIDQYVRYTGDRSYWWQGGLEVMVGVARFWAQRVHWSEVRKAWVMHGVTGPNEYENNVNNNWYTNYFINHII